MLQSESIPVKQFFLHLNNGRQSSSCLWHCQVPSVDALGSGSWRCYFWYVVALFPVSPSLSSFFLTVFVHLFLLLMRPRSASYFLTTRRRLLWVSGTCKGHPNCKGGLFFEGKKLIGRWNYFICLQCSPLCRLLTPQVEHWSWSWRLRRWVGFLVRCHVLHSNGPGMIAAMVIVVMLYIGLCFCQAEMAAAMPSDEGYACPLSPFSLTD